MHVHMHINIPSKLIVNFSQLLLLWHLLKGCHAALRHPHHCGRQFGVMESLGACWAWKVAISRRMKWENHRKSMATWWLLMGFFMGFTWPKRLQKDIWKDPPFFIGKFTSFLWPFSIAM